MSLPLPTTTLYPTWGAAYARNVQCYDLDGSVPTVFEASDVLTATVSPAQNDPAIFAPSVAWFNAGLCQVQLTMTGSQTGLLSIDTIYWCQIFGTRGGTTYPLAWTWLQVVPAAGAQGPASPPDMVALPYANQLLGAIQLTPSQFEQVPTLITGVSNAIRSFCNRMFIRQTYTEILPVAQNGTIRMAETPVNQVYLVQASPERAISIANSTATGAWVTTQTSGGLYILGSGVGNLQATGLILNSQAAGALTIQPIPFTPNMTIGALGDAIGAYGSGWTAVADVGFEDWPVTELFDTYAGKGAGPNDLPDGAANYHVFSAKISDHRPDPDFGQHTGTWWVGRMYGGGLAMRWGPGALSWDGAHASTTAEVRVTYDGGPPIVPYELQSIAVELVKLQLSRFETDTLLSGETAAEYSYQLAQAQIAAFPPQVLQTLYRYRISNA